ncbi:hypothetical protein H2200_012503 [Cladophialophora chaetospira]|uniref:Integral membrane protein n=1 Tax=Cladophialophora chaetospira TaxID=386627 RepID=A0AA38WXY2_9EURO|nr:hypothetical protein H2200_012503 [Cladophialophora chaetospira]
MRREHDVRPRVVKPVLRAYALGYLTAVAPRIFDLLRRLRHSNLKWQEQLERLRSILVTSAQLNRFPTACAILIGGATAAPRLVVAILQWILGRLPQRKRSILLNGYEVPLRALCSFLAAWVAFDLLNRDDAWVRKRAMSRGIPPAVIEIGDQSTSKQQHRPPPSFHPRFAGKTIDFTSFAFCRALDLAVASAWTRFRVRCRPFNKQSSQLASLIQKGVDPSIFALSAAVIMWSWFYSPERLPRSYNHWISKVAKIDSRLIQALRLVRQGDFVYGENTGQASLLAGLCRDLELPAAYADPAKTIPIPCELYHCGTGKSCEVHAASRFWRSWQLAMKLYAPLQILAFFRSPKSRSILESLRAAAISSSFLATFVSSFYYAVCLARTRLGPKIVSYKTITPQMWDSGLCVLAGCLACGWSILLEEAGRRREISLFAAPRAFVTMFPRVYDRRYQRREQIVFATSIAAVLTAIKSGQEKNVRGVFGRMLGSIMKDG